MNILVFSWEIRKVLSIVIQVSKEKERENVKRNLKVSFCDHFKPLFKQQTLKVVC